MNIKSSTILKSPPTRKHVLLALAWYDSQIHRGIARYARQAGWILDNSMARDGMAPERWDGDGVIGVVGDRFDVAKMARNLTVPMVDLAWQADELDLPRVLPDNEEIGRLGAEHLLERGYEHLAFFNHSDDWADRERCEPFIRHVHATGLEPVVLNWRSEWRRSNRDRRDAPQWLAEELTRLPKPLAVMATADHGAALVIEGCELAGLQAPEQVAVLGVNNSELDCEFGRVPLSSVDPALDRLGFEGSALLDRLMTGEAAPSDPIRIPPRGVVTRRSTDIIAVAHVHVARAIRFIWEHFTEPISVDDVVAAVPMSRAGLYRTFQRYTGRSIADEIARRRVELARRLLADTDEKVHEVARRCGFGSVVSFSRTFSRVVGQPPSTFRRDRREGR